MRYDREYIKKGAFITLDAPVDRPLYFHKKAPPRPVRYGDPDPEPFAEVSDRLDSARQRLEQILRDVRNARSN